MASDQRWTDQTERMLDELLGDTAQHCGCGCGHHADTVLAALADAGVLMLPGVVIVASTASAAGFQKRVEWSTEPSMTRRWVAAPPGTCREIITDGQPDPEKAMRDYIRGHRGRPQLVRRSVYIGPWEAVDG